MYTILGVIVPKWLRIDAADIDIDNNDNEEKAQITKS